MRKILVTIAIIATATGLRAQEIKVPTERYKLNNGLEVIFIDYGSLPATHVGLYVNTGRRNEAPGQQSLASMTANALLLGNTKYDRVKQDEIISGLGSTVASVANDQYTQVSFNFLNRDAAKAMEVFASIVLTPTFPNADIQEEIRQLLDFNNPQKMDITNLADMYSDLVTYGTGNPLGRHFYAKQLNKITTQQVKEYYDFNYTPKNSKLVVSGHPNRAEMKQLVSQYFDGWQAAYGENNGSDYDVETISKKDIYFINRPLATQAALNWAKAAPKAGSKDALLFMMANAVFSTILFDEIRVKEGKTYGISSRYSEDENNGMYHVTTQVRNEVALATTQSFDRVLKDFYEKGITAEQLQVAKTRYKARYTSAQTPDEMSAFFNPLIYKDYAKRSQYLSDIDAITLDQVNKTIKKYYAPGSYKLVLAGDEEQLKQQLSEIPSLIRLQANMIEVDN